MDQGFLRALETEKVTPGKGLRRRLQREVERAERILVSDGEEATCTWRCSRSSLVSGPLSDLKELLLHILEIDLLLEMRQ
jgi:hypothetical protein